MMITTLVLRCNWHFLSDDILLGMSMFKVNVVARNPKQEELETQPVEALVDTGSELTWLPGEILQRVGITPRRKRIFATATQQKIEREVGYAILSAEGYETNGSVKIWRAHLQKLHVLMQSDGAFPDFQITGAAGT